MTPAKPTVGPWQRVGRDHARMWSNGVMAAACRWVRRGRWIVTIWSAAGIRKAVEERLGDGDSAKSCADVALRARGWLPVDPHP